MPGSVAALYRHPIKGFTPERLDAALLEAGAAFPCDRLYAVENGPSGFDPTAPAFLPKTKFTALASIPALARAKTVYDPQSRRLTVTAHGREPFSVNLGDDAGRQAFAGWLESFVPAEDLAGPLAVLTTAGPHRFMDDAAGAVSLVNLASLRELGERLGREIDPRRLRANVYVDGWPAWSELSLAPGAIVRLGGVEARVVKPIVRCAATHVDPASGERDLDLVPALHAHYGHLCCGLYLQIDWGGELRVGDRASADLSGPMVLPTPEKRERRPRVAA